jgi:hypothetical protein
MRTFKEQKARFVQQPEIVENYCWGGVLPALLKRTAQDIHIRDTNPATG